MAYELTPHEPAATTRSPSEPAPTLARPPAGRRRDRRGRGGGDGRPAVARSRGIEPAPVAAAADEDPETVTILAGAPASIDPAKHGDLGSASYVTQLFETLTAVDPSLTVRPALAESWSVEEGGTRVVFTLRDGLTFSDGSSLTATDVVRSWRRLFDPREPSPLASLIADVKGARALLNGETDDVSTLGRARGRRPARHRRPRTRRVGPAGDRVRRAVRDRPAVGGRRRDPADARQLRRQRRLPREGGHRRRVRARGQPVVLGGRARDQDRSDAHQPRRQQPGRRVRRGRPRRGADLVHRRRLDRLRPPARAVAPQRPVAIRDVLRVRHPPEAVRRPAGPPGVRPGRGLAPPRDARRARLVGRGDRASSRPASPAGRRATTCRRTTRRPHGRCSPRPATRAVPHSARSRSSPAAVATTAR